MIIELTLIKVKKTLEITCSSVAMLMSVGISVTTAFSAGIKVSLPPMEISGALISLT